jgi:DNA primase
MNYQRLLEEIKSRIDIVEFVSDYVSLQKAGQNLKGLCPFHSEKTPSFTVSPSKQIFHCFGCSTGGDVVTFLMKQENLSFAEAIRYLAQKTGIELKGFAQEKNSAERDALLRLNEHAARYFEKTLSSSPLAIQYLEKRGIRREFLGMFRIGFSGDGRDGLCKNLRNNNFPAQLLLKAGVASPDNGGIRDYFRRRIIFPICNQRGDVIAFGGRVMDNSLPKYVNSPETEIFRKGETLFGMHSARECIRKKGFALIVEGYLDVIVCHQGGFSNAVAPLGTALTVRHLEKLRSVTKKVVLVFDGDQAGKAAASRALPVLCESGYSIRILLLPEGEDPDSFIRLQGSEAFERLIGSALSVVELRMQSVADRTDAVRETLSLIAAVRDPLKAEEMLGELRDVAGMNESVLRNELEVLRKKTGGRSVQKKVPSAPACPEERLLLSCLLLSPQRAAELLSGLSSLPIRDALVGSVFGKMVKAGKSDMALLLRDASEEEKSLLTELSLDPGIDGEKIDENIEDCLLKLRLRELEEQRRTAEVSGNVLLLDSLLKEKRKLIKKVE